MKQITIIIEDKLGTILSSKSLCDSSLELIRNNDNELTVIIKSDEFLITDWRTNVLPSDPIELPSDEEMVKTKYEHEMCVFADEYASYVLEQSKSGIKGAMVSMCAWTFFKNRNNEQQ